MREAGIGRVLVASLHEGISDVLPARLSFYENWLTPEGLRGGTIGLAPLYAVLSFLRQEGDAYEKIMTRAGENAADWSVDSMTPFKRKILGATPRWVRIRLVLNMGRQLVRRSFEGNRARVRTRGPAARIEVRDSIFCNVRERGERPLCGFYAAAFARLLQRFDLDAGASVTTCRGANGPSCQVTVDLLHEGSLKSEGSGR